MGLASECLIERLVGVSDRGLGIDVGRRTIFFSDPAEWYLLHVEITFNAVQHVIFPVRTGWRA